ncbi:ABC transporter permease [Amycolatopsis sp. K13G38]|uniref:Transport permease protein n=1 Tax=Amycolatopsis acididurans TaxID=2724524 RepID=A0ABX1IVB5_9PSEU|nr:ABC transporter permease [Amycolatopsis acididurans]NKQ51403.1 ABC transporter permease [Amycolatopsis acididurans]
MSALAKGISDGGVITWRNLMNIRRNPDWLMAATLQPIMFVLLFAYVFGDAIGGAAGGAAYREFLIAGIFAQTVAFNSAFTVIGFANDLQKGIIDRFRSLPMSRLAVVLGRTMSDLVVSVVALLVMSLCGLIVGWRIHGGFGDAVLGYLVMLMFAWALSWVGALIGLVARSVEVAQSAGLIWMFPLSFISSAFVPLDKLPGILRVIAEWNPFTAVINATRNLFGNHFGAAPVGWPAQHAALYSVVCCVVIIAIFAPLATARYRKVASK